jgi:DNA-binding NarL/FixJ family response regulator
MPKLLLLEDQPGWEALIVNAIRNGQLTNCTIHRAETYGEAVRLMREHSFHVAVLDYTLERCGPEGRKTGLDVARELRAAAPNAAILLVTLADPQRLQPDCDELYVTLVEKGRPDLEDEIIREVNEGLASEPRPPEQTHWR